MTVLGTQRTVWHEVQVETPEDWELLQYARDMREGRLGWADRHHYRLEIGYREVEAEPNFERFLSDYKVKLEVQEARKIKDLRAEGWPGFSAHHDGRFTTRFFRYLGPQRYLVEVVFAWPEQRDTGLEREVLRSIQGLRPRPEPDKNKADLPDTLTTEAPRRYEAFGLNLELSAEWHLREAQIEPALARLVFGPQNRDRFEKRFERYGMVDLWLEGSLEDWLRQQLPPKTTVLETEILHPSGHEVVELTGTVPRESWIARLQGPLHVRAAAWRCPVDGRIYHLRSIANKEPSPTHRDSLRCCPAHCFSL
ncbi:MAG: hypothetical protein ACFB20_06575 [Opitutales bacterium]